MMHAPNGRVHRSCGLARQGADWSRRVADACRVCVCRVRSRQACAQVENMEGYATYAGHASYGQLVGIAKGCGHPESTVKVTPCSDPALYSQQECAGWITSKFTAEMCRSQGCCIRGFQGIHLLCSLSFLCAFSQLLPPSPYTHCLALSSGGGYFCDSGLESACASVNASMIGVDVGCWNALFGFYSNGKCTLVSSKAHSRTY